MSTRWPLTGRREVQTGTSSMLIFPCHSHDPSRALLEAFSTTTSMVTTDISSSPRYWDSLSCSPLRAG